MPVADRKQTDPVSGDKVVEPVDAKHPCHGNGHSSLRAGAPSEGGDQENAYPSEMHTVAILVPDL